jgi:hypothetical protein
MRFLLHRDCGHELAATYEGVAETLVQRRGRSSGYGELAQRFFTVPTKTHSSGKRASRPRTELSVFCEATVPR